MRPKKVAEPVEESQQRDAVMEDAIAEGEAFAKDVVKAAFKASNKADDWQESVGRTKESEAMRVAQLKAY